MGTTNTKKLDDILKKAKANDKLESKIKKPKSSKTTNDAADLKKWSKNMDAFFNSNDID